jgi:hypothetical protein
LKALQGADLHDGIESIKFNSTDQDYIFLRVQMLDANNQLQCGYTMNTHQYKGGSIDFNEEECVFDGAQHLFSLHVSVFVTNTLKEFNYSECGGQLTFPLSRLEDNVPVRMCCAVSDFKSILFGRLCNGINLHQ